GAGVVTPSAAHIGTDYHYYRPECEPGSSAVAGALHLCTPARHGELDPQTIFCVDYTVGRSGELSRWVPDRVRHGGVGISRLFT
ncbi:MAG: hypothetical protein Q9M13_03265, partial [Mariprofundales bacterium]|nr:hypothetical protein [Mariprofundales bacterium]